MATLNQWSRRHAPGFELFDERRFSYAFARAQQRYQPVSSVWWSPGEEKRPVLSASRIMREVCRDPEREGYGVPFIWWYLKFEKDLLGGKVIQDPWSEVKWWLWNEMRGKGETLTMHGCQNSAKTAWMGRFGTVQLTIWDQLAKIYVTGPYKKHGEDKVWNELKPKIEGLKAAVRDSWFIKHLNLQFIAQTETCSVFNRETGGKGDATFVALENASAIQGKKADIHDTSGMIGVTCLMVDEFIENPNLELKQGEGNIASNHNFFGILACNPKPELVQHPAVLPFSAPVDIMNHRREEHVRWRTAYGICARFGWLNCPNRILADEFGRGTVWPYLLDASRIKRAKNKGSDTIDSQIDAWGFGSGVRGAPLTEAQIRTAGTYNEPAAWQTRDGKLMVIDCAYGGEDPATATILEYGEAILRNSQNEPVHKFVFSGVSQQIIPVDSDFHASEEWLFEMRERFAYSGGDFGYTAASKPIQSGDRLGGEWDLAGKVLQLAIDNDVPASHITFDSSQRGDSTNTMLNALGRTNIRWYYEGSRPIKREEELSDAPGWFLWPYQYETVGKPGEELQEPRKWSTYCSQTSSMVWFFSCNMIKAGYLINGGHVDKGLKELCSRPVVTGRHGQGEGRRDVLGKDKLKEMGLKSPTYGEGLAMGIYFGTRFLGAVPLDEPKLTEVVKPQPVVGHVIYANRGRKFGMGQSYFGTR